MLPIIITTSPKYRHLFPKFFQLYFEFWNEPRKMIIDVAKEGESWTAQMNRILSEHSYSHFIRLSEEFFIGEPILFERLCEAEEMIINDPRIIRIGLQTVNEGYNKCSKQYKDRWYELTDDAEYACSLEASIFSRQPLQQFLASMNDAHIWEAEVVLSEKFRSVMGEDKNKVLVHESRIITYKDAMRRGESRHPEFENIL